MSGADRGSIMRRAARVLIALALMAAAAWAQSAKDCMECHGRKPPGGGVKPGEKEAPYVDLAGFRKSVHGQSGLECTDCHSTIEKFPHPKTVSPVLCSDCHDDAQEAYAESAHALGLKNEGPKPATCTGCHGTHDILASDNPESLTAPAHVAALCGTCHSRADVIALFGPTGRNPVTEYRKSIHARPRSGRPGAPNAACTDCHGWHGIYRKTDLRSTIADPEIPSTCGKCHGDQEKKYRRSVHWFAVKRGFYSSPTCIGCHGAHNIDSPEELGAAAPEEGLTWQAQVCKGCHSSRILMERFGLDWRRFESYMKTYHALARLRGSRNAAICISCHATHDIEAPSSPSSSVNPGNLMKTCGKCHQDVNPRFVEIPIHPIDMEARNPVAFWTKALYPYVVVFLIGGMILHNLVIFFYHVRSKYLREKKVAYLQRFRPFEVCQHALLTLSFLTLAVTGFALKFPEVFWSQWLRSAGMTEAVRSHTHRAAGVVLLVISFVQLLYLAGTRRGRRDVRALRPTPDDLKQLGENMRYHLRLSRRRPAFPRFDYTEKLEYIALAWGVALMGFTGLVLWFPEVFMRLLPLWTFETAEVIHFYEAILATLAILFWHVFLVVYHPEFYPMKLTWLHGRITEADARAHHPAEYVEEKANARDRDRPPDG